MSDTSMPAMGSSVKLDRSKLSSDEVKSLLIIEAIQKHPCIWKKNHPDKHTEAKLSEAWECVQNDVKLSVIHCKEKWRNLRDTLGLRVILARFKIKDEILLHKHVSSGWPLFPAMVFLISEIGGCHNVLSLFENSDSDLLSPNTYGIVNSDSEHEDGDSEVSDSEDSEEEASFENAKSSEINSAIELEPLTLRYKPKTKDAECDQSFLLSLLPSIKSLPEERRIMLRIRIQKIIGEYFAQLK